METKHEKKGGSHFFWGLVIGALLATLLTTKKGRLILREIVNLGLELIEELIEEKKRTHSEAVNEAKKLSDLSDFEEGDEDVVSEVTEAETPPDEVSSAPEEKASEERGVIEEEHASEAKTNGNGHHKKRLFRGVRRK
jgi:hypothetical protein